MGLFSKKSITVDQLAELLGDLAWKDFEDPFPSEESEEPTLEQRKEALIFSMLAGTRAIRAAADKLGSEDLLNAYHLNIYRRISKDDAERADFERLLRDRYTAYHKLMDPNDKHWLAKVGNQFARYYSGEDNPALLVSSSIVFGKKGVIYKQFIDEVLSKAELKR